MNRAWLTVLAMAGSICGAGWSVAQDAGGSADQAWSLGDPVAEPPGDDDAAPDPPGGGPAERPETRDEGELPAAPEEAPDDADPTTWVDALLERCGPPSLPETMDAAVAEAGLDPGLEDDLLDQARWAAALPRVRFTLRRDWQHDESLDLDPDPTADNYGVDTDAHLEIGVTAQWDLDGLVAPDSAASLRRIALDAQEARQALRLEVAKAYSERCRLRLEWEAAPEDASRRVELAWAIAERTARLDALTGGFFRRSLEEQGTAVQEGPWSNGSSARRSDTR
jgi:hypothetical protein